MLPINLIYYYIKQPGIPCFRNGTCVYRNCVIFIYYSAFVIHNTALRGHEITISNVSSLWGQCIPLVSIQTACMDRLCHRGGYCDILKRASLHSKQIMYWIFLPLRAWNPESFIKNENFHSHKELCDTSEVNFEV